jgi:hypothetical protein
VERLDSSCNWWNNHHHILLLGLPKHYGRRISTPFSMDCILSWFGRIFYNFFDGGPQAAALGKSGFNA